MNANQAHETLLKLGFTVDARNRRYVRLSDGVTAELHYDVILFRVGLLFWLGQRHASAWDIEHIPTALASLSTSRVI